MITFSGNIIGEDAARAWSIAEPQNVVLPPAGTLLPTSFAFSLPTLKGISIDPKDPFKIDFIVDTANQSLKEKLGQAQVNLLIKYFLSFLTLPEEDLWVNLSPYEKNRIIASGFETTNAGRDMLTQDYILKQLASSLTYPENETGKIFWKKVYDRAKEQYGSTDIPVNTFNKVWVVPDRAVVYEGNGSAYISESRLKVLTEEDYLSIEKHTNKLNLSSSKIQEIDHLSTEVTREIIIPELEREVNEGKYFAPLRQMYNSLILAIWFKKRLKENLISIVYVNQKKIVGIALNEKQIKEKIYAQYLRAYKKGVYNYIKEEVDPVSNDIVPRKYFSGGFSFIGTAKEIDYKDAAQSAQDFSQMSFMHKALSLITIKLEPLGGITKSSLISLALAGAFLMGGTHRAEAKGATDLIAHRGGAIHRTITPEEKALNNVKNIDVVNIYNAHVMNNLEAAEKTFENIQPGQEGYGLKKDVVKIYDIMHDKQLRAAFSEMPNGGRSLYTWINETPEGKYFLQKSGELKALEKKLKEVTALASAPAVTLVPVTPPPAAVTPPPTPVVTPTVTSPVVPHVAPVVAPPTVTSAVIPPVPPVVTPLITPVTPAPAAGTPQPPSAPVPVPAVTSPPVVAAPAATPALQTSPGILTTQVPVGNPYEITTNNVTFHFAEDPLTFQHGGYVEPPDTNHLYHAEYKSTEPLITVTDPLVDERIESAQEKVVSRDDYFNMVASKYAQGIVSSQEYETARAWANDARQDLANALWEKTTLTNTAPYDLNVENPSALYALSGQEVKAGEVYAKALNHQKVEFNLPVPGYVNNFNNMTNVTVNNQPAYVVDYHWSLGPNQTNGILKLVVAASSPLSITNNHLDFHATVQPAYQVLEPFTDNTHTLTLVQQEDQIEIKTHDDGHVRFLVKEGDWVIAGQPVAVTENINVQEAYTRANASLESKTNLLKLAIGPNGISYLKSEDLLKLKDEIAKQKALVHRLDLQRQQLTMYASQNGFVRLVARYQSTTLRKGEVALKISGGTALIGDLNGTNAPVLVPKDPPLHYGDVMIGETADGVFVPLKVLASSTPQVSDKDLSDYQSPLLMAFNEQGSLRQGSLIHVHYKLTEQQKLEAINYIHAFEQSHATPSAGSPPPAPPKDNLNLLSLTNQLFANTNADYLAVRTNLPLSSMGNLDLYSQVINQLALGPTNTEALKLNFTTLSQGLSNNRYVVRIRVNQIDQQKAAKKLPNAWKLVAGGDFFWQNGKIVGDGNLMATAVGGLAEGGGRIGTAYSELGAVVGQLAGKGVEWAQGVPSKRNALAESKKDVINYEMHSQIDDLGFSAHSDLIDLWAAQQQERILSLLLAQEEAAKKVLAQRLEGPLSQYQEVYAATNAYLDTQNQIHLLDIREKNLTASLNYYLGGLNTNFHRPIIAQLPDETFPQISISNDFTHNPKYLEALSQIQVATNESRLYKAEHSPFQVTIGQAYIDNRGGALDEYTELTPQQRASSLVDRENVAVNAGVSAVDTARKAEIKILGLRQEEARLNKEAVVHKILEEETQKVDEINGLSQIISIKKQALESALSRLQIDEQQQGVVKPLLYPDFIEINKVIKELTDAEKEYWQDKQDLLTRLHAAVHAVAAKENPDHAQLSSLSMGSLFNKLAMIVMLAVGVSAPAWGQPQGGEPRPTYEIQETDLNRAWAVMRGGASGQLAAAREEIYDSNISKRHQAFLDFVKYYSDDPQFLSTVRQIVLNTTDDDVLEDFFNFMSQPKHFDVNFFIQTIDEAGNPQQPEVQPNHLVVEKGFKWLKYVFENNPQVFEELSHSRLASSKTANMVFLNFLSREPNDSKAKDLFLFSDVWNPDHWGSIYKSLVAYNNAHPDVKVKDFSDLISDMLLAKGCLLNIPRVFELGDYRKVGEDGDYPFAKDLWSKNKISTWRQANEYFLRESRGWRKMEGNVSPALLKFGQETRDDILSSSQPLPWSLVIYNVPYQITGNSYSDLSSFNSLGLKDKQAYIAKSKNISEVYEIFLKGGQETRAGALQRLMEDNQGIIWALKAAFVDQPSDDNILYQVENYPSLFDILRERAKTIADHTEDYIFSQAIQKLGARDKQFLDINTQYLVQLHSLTDPLAGKYIDAQSARLALDVLNQQIEIDRKNPWWHFWPRAGYSVESGPSLLEYNNIKDQLNKNPLDIKSYLDRRAKEVKDKDAKNLLKNFRYFMDNFSKSIKVPNTNHSDQTVPKAPLNWWINMSILGFMNVAFGGFLLTMFRDYIEDLLFPIKKRDTPDRILRTTRKLINVARLDHLDSNQGNGRKLKINTRRDGLKIIDLPSPQRVDEKAGKYLTEIWKIVIDWNGQEKLSEQEIIEGSAKIRALTQEALKQMPYKAEFMKSPSGNYFQTLSYVGMITDYSLYLLDYFRKKVEFKNKKNQEQLDKEVARLVNDIDYTKEYINNIHSTGAASRTYSRQMPQDHPLEEKKILGKSLYRWVRWAVYFDQMHEKMIASQESTLENLLIKGRHDLGLYRDISLDPEASIDSGGLPTDDTIRNIIKKGLKFRDEKIETGGTEGATRAFNSEIKDRWGNFYREFFVPIKIAQIIFGIVITGVGISSGNAFMSISFMIFTYFNLASLFSYIVPNLIVVRDLKWAEEYANIAGELQKSISQNTDAAQLSSPEDTLFRPDLQRASAVQRGIQIVEPDTIDRRIISQLMAGYSKEASLEVLISQIQQNLSGEGEGANVKVEIANLKRLLLKRLPLIKGLLEPDFLLDRIKRSNPKEILFTLSLEGQTKFKPSPIDYLHPDLPVIHINAGVREYYFIVGTAYPSLVRMKDAAMNAGAVLPKVQIKRQGGVDFSNAENSVQFRENSSSGINIPSPSGELGSLNSFKGFDFQVIQYKPILNPVKFFLGSSVDHSGAWFSGSVY